MPRSASPLARIGRYPLILLGVLALLVAAVAIKLRMDGLFRAPVYETSAPDLPADLQHPAILVFSKTNGFIHKEAIPAAQELFKKLGEANGWTRILSNSAKIVNILGGYGYHPALADMAACIDAAETGVIQ